MCLESLELFGQLRIAHLIGTQIYDTDAHSVLHFAFAQVVQIWLPPRVLFQVFSDMLGKKNVPGITAIHYPLSDVDPGSGDIGLVV